MKNVLVLEFITSFGGVQSVYRNILPELAKHNKIFFLNPYSGEDDLKISQNNIEIVDLLLKSPKALEWKKSLFQKISVFLKYGIRYFAYFFSLVKFVNKKNIDLLYVSGKKEFFFALLIKYFCKVPYIYHAHGFGKVEDINRFTKLAIKNSKYVICVSSDVMNKIRKSGIDSDNIVVVSNGLNLEDATKKIEQVKLGCIHDEQFTVSFGGTIQPQKGVLTLVKAVMLLNEKGYNIKLNLIGNCNDEKYLDEIKNNSSDNVVSVCGFADNIYEHFLATDIVILPSREESFGMVLLEAMYAKKAVIGSNIGGIPDIIVDGENGFLFECDNYIDLAEKISILYNDRDLCHSMGRKGFYRVCEVFTSEKQSNLINLFINK